MAVPSPTQSTPAGCVIGVLALIPFASFVIGVWGLVKWFSLASDQREINTYFWAMTVAAGIGLLVTVLMIWFSFRTLRSTDYRGYDSRDPDESDLKW